MKRKAATRSARYRFNLAENRSSEVAEVVGDDHSTTREGAFLEALQKAQGIESRAINHSRTFASASPFARMAAASATPIWLIS